MERHDDSLERNLATALRRLNGATVVPAADPAREAALLAAFDAAAAGPRRSGTRVAVRQYWYMAALATAAAVLMAAGITPALIGRHGPLPGGAASHSQTPPFHRGVQSEPPSEFVLVPGAAGLPPMESGTLVRIDLPVSALSQYGVSPPAGRTRAVTADLIVGQDGLTRAVRIVN